jgi:hypothetical protein
MADPLLSATFRRRPAQTVPAIVFLDPVPLKVRAEIQAVLDAVAAAPPPSFSGGGKWEVMHNDMAGFYEVRVRGADRRNHRLFCILERDAEDLGGSSIVCVDGLPSRFESLLHPGTIAERSTTGRSFGGVAPFCGERAVSWQLA